MRPAEHDRALERAPASIGPAKAARRLRESASSRPRTSARRRSRSQFSCGEAAETSGTGRRARHAGPRSGAPRGGRADALGDRGRRFRPGRPLARHAARRAGAAGRRRRRSAAATAATLLALLKHPLAAFGMPARDARRAARALERAVLRGPRLEAGPRRASPRAVEHAAAERWRADDDEAERPRLERSRARICRAPTGPTAADLARRSRKRRWRRSSDLAERAAPSRSPIWSRRMSPRCEATCARRSKARRLRRSAAKPARRSPPPSRSFWRARRAARDIAPRDYPGTVLRADRARRWCAGAAGSTRASTSGARSRRGCRASTWSCSAA